MRFNITSFLTPCLLHTAPQVNLHEFSFTLVYLADLCPDFGRFVEVLDAQQEPIRDRAEHLLLYEPAWASSRLAS